ncbi:MAG TPA: hypothetical protein VHM19_05370 [Polyangiales bacterium]|nr:hypothetical protein [Polyangiales bacterium]
MVTTTEPPRAWGVGMCILLGIVGCSSSAAGVVEGTVTDCKSGDAILGVHVEVHLEGHAYTGETDVDGDYSIQLEEKPTPLSTDEDGNVDTRTSFSVHASRQGYLPFSDMFTSAYTEGVDFCMKATAR